MAYVHIQIFTSGTWVAFASKIKYLILTNKINKEKKITDSKEKKQRFMSLYLNSQQIYSKIKHSIFTNTSDPQEQECE